MKKIAFACLLLLSAASFFFACQKETVVTATEAAASNTENITLREDASECGYEVTIYGADGTNLCGTLNAPGGGKCYACDGQYGKFGIESSPITRTMLGNVFAITNPTSVAKSVSFTMTGAACSSGSFIIGPNKTKTFRIAKMPTPAPGCCRVVEYNCVF